MKLQAISAFVCVATLSGSVLKAEEPASAFSVEFGADVVSSYIWRGQELGGFSVQPSVTFTWTKPAISFGVWASAELFEKSNAANMTEFDLSLSWNPIESLTIGLTDYYLSGNSYFSGWTWNAAATHNLEAQLAYDFGPVALSWNTCLTGPDHHFDGELKRNYSTYVELSAPYEVAGVKGSMAVGASLWDDGLTAIGNDKFNVCNISLSAEKEIFHLPMMGQIVFNPQTDNAYFVVGLTF